MTHANPLPLTAAVAYARHARHALAILGCVEDALEAHRRWHAARPHDWGLVGDLAAAEGLLKQVLHRLGGMTPGQIDHALDAIDDEDAAAESDTVEVVESRRR